MTITREKIVALFAVAGCLLILSKHFVLGALCEAVVFVVTLLGSK